MSCLKKKSTFDQHTLLASSLQQTDLFLESFNIIMPPTIVLITGANRGLGKGLLKRYLALPNHTVIAANRDP